jgi:RNA polymerase sigma-70 factor (ECF subfamily)
VRQLEFADFYQASRDVCLRAVLASVVDRELAEDLVAEAFTRAWMSWPTVSRHPAPRAWIVRTALNTQVSWWRRRRQEVPLDTGHRDAVATTDSAAGVDPALLQMLRSLPRRQREVIAFRVFLDLDNRATAELLGIAEGTVTAHLSRAVATLRGQLVTEEHPGGCAMTDHDAAATAVLGALKDAFDDVTMPAPVAQIVAAGRLRRRRRRLVKAGCAMAAIAGLAAMPFSLEVSSVFRVAVHQV